MQKNASLPVTLNNPIAKRAKQNMITSKIQQPIPEDVGLIRCPGVCGLDGHSQALEDGFMASRYTGEADIGFKAEN